MSCQVHEIIYTCGALNIIKTDILVEHSTVLFGDIVIFKVLIS